MGICNVPILVSIYIDIGSSLWYNIYVGTTSVSLDKSNVGFGNEIELKDARCICASLLCKKFTSQYHATLLSARTKGWFSLGNKHKHKQVRTPTT